MKIWFDTEFIEDGRTIDLLSIGMVREDGATYYAEPAETDRSRACEWVTANVLPHLHGPVKPRAEIADDIVAFAGDHPEFWAYYAAYDWVALCQMFGRMIDLPDGWPMFCRDVQQVRAEAWVVDLPPMTGAEHNALDDARWAREAHDFLTDALATREANMHGYRYTLPLPDGDVTWEGSGYLARDIAETAFETVCREWINDALPDPPKWWQFWRSDVERPDPTKHVY